MTPPDSLNYRPGAASIFAAHARASELASELTRPYWVSSPEAPEPRMRLLSDAMVAELRGLGFTVEEIR